MQWSPGTFNSTNFLRGNHSLMAGLTIMANTIFSKLLLLYFNQIHLQLHKHQPTTFLLLGTGLGVLGLAAWRRKKWPFAETQFIQKGRSKERPFIPSPASAQK